MLEELRAKTEEHFGALSIEEYEAGCELTDEVLDDIRDEATQIASDELDTKLPITGIFGPRNVCDFREMTRYEMEKAPYVHCAEMV